MTRRNYDEADRNPKPFGREFLDAQTQRIMVYCTQGKRKGWLYVKQRDGSWLPLRRAHYRDIAELREQGIIP